VSYESNTPEPWGTPEMLLEGNYLPPFGRNRTFDVSPDGRFAIIRPAIGDSGTTSEMADMVVVQNWFTELTDLVPVPQ